MVCLLAVTACGNATEPTADESTGFSLDGSEIRSIANVFAIQKGMTLLCEGNEADYLTPFMEDLRYAGAPKALRDEITSESVEMMNKIGAEEPEYICTPEMFESSAERVVDAQKKWDVMRGISE